jgi:hypothetical protein
MKNKIGSGISWNDIIAIFPKILNAVILPPIITTTAVFYILVYVLIIVAGMVETCEQSALCALRTKQGPPEATLVLDILDVSGSRHS